MPTNIAIFPRTLQYSHEHSNFPTNIAIFPRTLQYYHEYYNIPTNITIFPQTLQFGMTDLTVRVIFKIATTCCLFSLGFSIFFHWPPQPFIYNIRLLLESYFIVTWLKNRFTLIFSLFYFILRVTLFFNTYIFVIYF